MALFAVLAVCMQKLVGVLLEFEHEQKSERESWTMPMSPHEGGPQNGTTGSQLLKQNQHLFISSLCQLCSLGGTALYAFSFSACFAFFGCQATPHALIW